jgi:S-adenosylhomocysteine hydrolase
MDDYAYPILARVTEHYLRLPHTVQNTYLICCQHMLAPQKQMFQELIRFGFDPEKIFVLGKTYSTNREILTELNAMGIRAIQPPFSGIAFDQEHRNNCHTLVEMVPKEASSIILDDGAELITVFAESSREVLFGVEQTSSGFRKLEGKQLRFPVLNVARSATKLIQESPLIARHAFERMDAYFQKTGLVQARIMIVGLGPIGEALREVFLEHDYLVNGFDVQHGHQDLMGTINDLAPDVIIGATGASILAAEDLEKLSGKKTLLISMSSSDREFPVAAYRNGITDTHLDIVYENITFVNNGFPISFMGNRYESTPMEMEKTMALLGGSVMSGSVHLPEGTGLLDLPKELETLINAK